MKKINLHIETLGESKTVSFEDEITIGRTDASQIVLDDSGLSRKNTTFFRDGEFVLIVDENSTNGTFVNGERISGEAKRVFDGDQIKIGSETNISIEIVESRESRVGGIQSSKTQDQNPKAEKPSPESQISNSKAEKTPFVLIASAGSIFLIVFLGLIIFLVARSYEGGGGKENRTRPPTAQLNPNLVIPIRVIDPLGGQDPEDLEDFLSSWGDEEEPLKAEDIEVLNISSTSPPLAGSQPRLDLNVSQEYWKKQKALSLSRGIGSPTISTPEIHGKGGFAKQLLKGAQLRDKGYKVPLDFGDLAGLRLKGELVELPIATESYVLEVGGSATDKPFTEFDFIKGDSLLDENSEKYKNLKRLAENFDGVTYDLNNPKDRKNMRMRLLRIMNPNSRKVFEQISAAYSEKFKVPLRVTSLMRSMDYQKALNAGNSNSYRVRTDTVPPHTTGCTFDVGRGNLPTDAQNFLITFLSDLEKQGKIDTLIEGNTNPCFHTFIYPDEVPLGQQQQSQPQPQQTPKSKK